MTRYRVPMEIDMLSRYYNLYRKAIKEYSLGIRKYSLEEIRDYRQIMRKLEFIAECLDDNQRLIIVNEVFERKKNRWYTGLMSEATYYRQRKQAYETFIDRVNK